MLDLANLSPRDFGYLSFSSDSPTTPKESWELFFEWNRLNAYVAKGLFSYGAVSKNDTF